MTDYNLTSHISRRWVPRAPKALKAGRDAKQIHAERPGTKGSPKSAAAAANVEAVRADIAEKDHIS